MRIVLAPDKFKECLSAGQVAEAMATGIRRADSSIEIDSCPMSDGGEGFVDAMVGAANGTLHTVRVTGPLSEMKVDATFGLVDDGKTAIIEMSSASGLHLLQASQYDPMATTTFGTGELIRHAIDAGATKILLGIGGSATTDGGIGCVQACGLPVLLNGGEPVSMTEPLCGRDVERVALIKHGRGERVGTVEVIAACDVRNPLFGPNGAARVFGPQKGATHAQVEHLDHALKQLATRCGKLDEANTPGAGAAGGLGFGLLAFLGARLTPGAHMVMDAVALRDRLLRADLCLTGEGRLDANSFSGKVVGEVWRLSETLGKRCLIIAGSSGGLTPDLPVASATLEAMSPSESMQRAPELIASATERALIRLLP